MSMFADYNDDSRANLFLKCFDKVFEFDEGRRTASMLNVQDYNDFLELLQESGAVPYQKLAGIGLIGDVYEKTMAMYITNLENITRSFFMHILKKHCFLRSK